MTTELKTFWVEWANTKNLIGTLQAENERQAFNRAANFFDLNDSDFTVREKKA